MAKLFLFGIGGTGARVIKSLTFLLAAGVQLPEGISSVVPILIDPDAANGDLNRTTNLLNLYQRIRQAGFDGDVSLGTHFFKSQLQTLASLSTDGGLQNNFHTQMEGIAGQKFRDYIGHSNFNGHINGDLASLLFSEENLMLDMQVGFKGNPNIGSVVLGQFEETHEFNFFASNFQQGDRIFIISSIFGGTGAAGFPLLLKTIRKAKANTPNSALLRDAPIGALSVLPYFALDKIDGAGNIDSNTFISKTKAALAYYQRNLIEGQQINAFYTIGDQVKKVYDNQPGEMAQKNAAHLIELAGALAVLDFAKGQHSTANGKASQVVHKEFGLETDSNSLSFMDLGQQTRALISRPLIAYKYAAEYASRKLLGDLRDGKTAFINAFPKSFESSGLWQDWGNFNAMFQEWLREMAENNRSFAPFNEFDEGNVFNMVRQVKADRGLFDIKSIDAFKNEMAKQKAGFDRQSDLVKRGFALFNSAIQKVVRDSYSI